MQLIYSLNSVGPTAARLAAVSNTLSFHLCALSGPTNQDGALAFIKQLAAYQFLDLGCPVVCHLYYDVLVSTFKAAPPKSIRINQPLLLTNCLIIARPPRRIIQYHLTHPEYQEEL